jgi:DNA-binding NtrC family response regulator
VLPVTVPPLRERRRDIGTLLTHFLADAGAAPPSRELVRQLEELPWRGNVRELRNFADRARALGQDEALARAAAAGAAASADGSPPSQRFTMPVVPPTLPRSPAPRETEDGGVFLQAYKEFRERWIDLGEREYVSRLLTRHGRNVTAAARDAGLDRTYLYRLIRKHEL